MQTVDVTWRGNNVVLRKHGTSHLLCSHLYREWLSKVFIILNVAGAKTRLGSVKRSFVLAVIRARSCKANKTTEVESS